MFELQTTPYGGRGLFATQDIPQGTPLHVCNGPYASVVFREFRKEICARCFAYAFDAGRSTWNTKPTDPNQGVGVWFCGDSCRDVWGTRPENQGLSVLVYEGIEKAVARMKKAIPAASSAIKPMPSIPAIIPLSTDFLDDAWMLAQNDANRRSNSKAQSAVVQLNEIELETARCVASVLLEQHTRYDRVPGILSDPEYTSPTSIEHPKWVTFLHLQNNELANISRRPQVLASHLRVYSFLCGSLPKPLQRYLEEYHTVRAFLARDDGNAFGIYQGGEGESEMFGWGVWVSASYFNHDCTPNVRKERIGRSYRFFARRDVFVGEELCINYVTLEDSVEERQKALQKGWYFDCVCNRCIKELAL